MKFNRYLKNNKWMPYATAGCVIVLFYLLLSHVNYFFIGVGRFMRYTSPVIVGVVIAYVIDPLAVLFERKAFKRYEDKPHIRRLISVWLAIAVVLLAFAVFMISLVPQVVKSLGNFFSNFDSYAVSLQNFLNTISLDAAENSLDISSITTLLDNEIERLADYIQDNLGSIVNTSINVGANIFNTVISFILAIYMLCDKERLLAAWRRFMRALLPDRRYAELSAFWARCNTILIRYIAGDLVDGLIVGIVNFIFMSIAGMDYAALISMIVGITNLAPTFGPLAGAVIGSLFLVFVNPWYALWFIIFTIILQTLDGYVIKPRLFGNTLGVSSLWILISIIVLGRMFGVIGILLAIPFAAISDIIYKEAILRRLEQRKEDKKLSPIFETHAHYDDDRFSGDRGELLTEGLKKAGIAKIMNVAADMASVDTTNALSLKHDNVYAALGVHPSETDGITEADIQHIRTLALKNKKVRAIGEIGFDYHYEKYDKDNQERWFTRQIELARELSLPVIVHSRDAAEDTLRVISAHYTGKEDRVNGVIHCFSYSKEEALKYISLGFFIGVGGVVTYNNAKKLKEVVHAIPLDRIVLETDSPYLPPEPHRGERNSSKNLPLVAAAIAELKGVTEDEVRRVTYDNAMRLYGLS